jgi:uncharacterized membrane protein YraQ (UPF0718 family)
MEESLRKLTESLARAGMWLFPAAVAILYLILHFLTPEKTIHAIRASGNILFNMLIPLSLVFILMLLLNLFLKPAQIVNLLGKGSGVRGLSLAVAGGIISTGPIYAWYPLLKDLKEKGAGNLPIAVFLHNRAVKPFLLPLMVAYFGWLYVFLLTIFTVVGSLVLGYSISYLLPNDDI